MTDSSEDTSEDVAISQSRFVLGGIVFALGFMSPLLVPLVARSDLPQSWKAVLSTGLVIGIPEIGMLIAVAILGKQGFSQLKKMIFTRLRKATEPAAVSQGRYRLGLFMFAIPLLVGLLWPYLGHFFPAMAGENLTLSIVLDLAFAFSFIVLGAGFWEKVRDLFRYTPVNG